MFWQHCRDSNLNNISPAVNFPEVLAQSLLELSIVQRILLRYGADHFETEHTTKVYRKTKKDFEVFFFLFETPVLGATHCYGLTGNSTASHVSCRSNCQSTQV